MSCFGDEFVQRNENTNDGEYTRVVTVGKIVRGKII